MGEYRLNRQKIYAFVGVLGYSRWLYFEYVESMASEVLIACHRTTLQAFGGVSREVLYDNMKTVVTERDAYGRGRHRFQKAIWALAGDRVTGRDCACRPGRRPRARWSVRSITSPRAFLSADHPPKRWKVGYRRSRNSTLKPFTGAAR